MKKDLAFKHGTTFIESIVTESDLSGKWDVITLRNGFIITLDDVSMSVFKNEDDYKIGNEIQSVNMEEKE